MNQTKRLLSGLCVAIAAVLVCLYACQLLFPESKSALDGSVLTVVQNPFAGAIYNSALVVAALAFVLGVVMLSRRARIGLLPLLVSILCLPVYLLSFFADGFGGFGGWTDESKVLDPSGAEYHLLSQGWQEGSWALARLSGSSLLQRRYEVLVEGTATDFGDGLQVARPANAPKVDGLFLAPSGMLVWVDSDGWASVAYDPKTDLRYRSYSSTDGKLRPIAGLSPFLLLGRSAFPDPSDAAKLIKPMGDGLKAAEADLKNPNPDVRRLVRRLLGDKGESPQRP